MKKSLKRKFSIIMTLLFTMSIFTAVNTYAAVTSIWTANPYTRVFKTDTVPSGASTSITWDAARNEYESYQILLRHTSSFTISSVSFSNLTSGNNTINNSNLSYKFQESYAPDGGTAYPDPLSNATSIAVSANTTQGIWVTVYVPKGQAAGTYTGTATVNTTAGNSTVNISLTVYNVEIPDAVNSSYTYSTWSCFFNDYRDSDAVILADDIHDKYGYTRYSTQWWSLMANIAKEQKASRENQLYVSLDLVLDGPTTFNGTTYTFNWSKFDQFIQCFIDNGAVKLLRGNSILNAGSTDKVWMIDNVGGTNKLVLEPVNTTKSNRWLDQFLPALKAHLDAKGWTNMWYQSISDEPGNGTNYIWAANKFRNVFGSGAKTQDALLSTHSELVGYESVWIPEIDVWQDNQAFFNSRQSAGDQVWTYTCGGPDPAMGWLNRHTTQPYYTTRLLSWGNFKYGLTGFYHWGYNAWYEGGYGGAEGSLGDGYIVYPDPANGNVKSSVRSISTRDGNEDYELFKILKEKDPTTAYNIVNSLVTAWNDFSDDINLMVQKRKELLTAAGTVTTTIKIGDTMVEPTTDSGNANWMVATKATLASQKVIQSISVYLPAVSGKIRLGIYSDSAGKPGNLLAATNESTPGSAGWLTLHTTSNPSLAAGTYWIAFLTDNNSMNFRYKSGGNCYGAGQTYGALPSSFPSAPEAGVQTYSIYATLQNASSTALPNASNYLTTPTYDGSGKATHPGVVYIPNGWNGYKYWMVMTPYPNSDINYENPSILVSNDNINWSVPSGLTNPLAGHPAVGHNNDPELVYNPVNNTMYMYYLEADDSTVTHLKVMYSTNGINWNSPATAFTSQPGQRYGVISPTALYNTTDSKYYMWYVNAGDNGFNNQTNTIEFRSSTGGSWSSGTTCNIPFSTLGIIPWHIDVTYVPEKNEYWMVFNAYTNGGNSGDPTKLWFAKSTDRINWTIDSAPLLNWGAAGTWDAHKIYRTNVLYDAPSNKIRLWYSANADSDNGNTWHIGYTEGAFDGVITNPVPPQSTWTTVDNASATFSGTWESWTDSRCYASGSKGSKTANSYSQYTFTGTGIKWIGQKDSNFGQADVYIDNVLQTTVDCYNSADVFQQELYTNTGLTNASHTIKIVCKGTHGSGSDNYIEVDAFKVLN